MGCTICHRGGNPKQNYMCIPENGPILPVLYETKSSKALFQRQSKSNPAKSPGDYRNCLETRFKTPKSKSTGTWGFSPRLHPGHCTDDLRSLTESTFYESTTTSGSNAVPRNSTYLSKPEFSSLDIVRRKSYLKHILIDLIPCFRSQVSIISRIVNFTVSLEYCDLIFLEVLSSRKGTAVFRAKRRDRTDSYAVKCVPKDKTENTNREYELLSSLSPHNFLISMRNSGWIETPGHNFLILQVVGQGINLHHRVRQHGKMGSNEVKFYATEFVAALSFLHGQGWLHRDVSLKNALLSKEGHIKLSDFDQSCRIGTLTEQNFQGQHPFPYGLAPEQKRGELQTEYADFWQLAWNLVWMSTGFLPKQIVDFPELTPSSLQVLCQSLLIEDLVERKKACQGNIKSLSYFEDVDWNQVSSEDPPGPPCPPPQVDRRIDKASEAVYYTTIYEFLNE